MENKSLRFREVINDAERSIRCFCAGKHNWKIIDSKKDVKAYAMLYSLAETVKVNNLKPYEYFSYLLTQLVNYPRRNVPKNELEKLMPRSAELPNSCRKTKDR